MNGLLLLLTVNKRIFICIFDLIEKNLFLSCHKILQSSMQHTCQLKMFSIRYIIGIIALPRRYDTFII